jgi:hypothetical protein
VAIEKQVLVIFGFPTTTQEAMLLKAQNITESPAVAVYDLANLLLTSKFS